MTIPLEQAKRIIETMQSERIQNLFAQSHAKHILFEVNEDPNNFPAFDRRLEDKVTFTAYSLLAVSCSMLEQDLIEQGLVELEAAASILYKAHGPFIGESRESNFHVLIASMAFYAAGHYSRAFVAIRRVESFTEIANVIARFIRKDMKSLVKMINQVLLIDIPEFTNQAEVDEWYITIAIVRSLASIVEFVITGAEHNLDEAKQALDDASIIAEEGMLPAQWWIVRLLRLMLQNLVGASLWQSLPVFFDPTSIVFLDQYIRLLAFSSPPVIELWASQRAALSMALNPTNRGGVINLRTSAGKTRVAELAILQTLSIDPTAKIIYLAPFRSLAFEMERTLSSSFHWLGFRVSHLYGGSRVSRVDTELVSESSIIIATPEKARALFRSAPELFINMKLIVIDEGHLLGPSERYVRNELFIDHLRLIARSVDARILLLSAVLPNSAELAEWITGDSQSVAISSWKPAAERFGILRWKGDRVHIDWIGDIESFNPNFVEIRPRSNRKNSRMFPATKNEAIAASAVRLSNLGPVMIFTGQARWVSSMAAHVLRALGNDKQRYPWPSHEWNIFESVCNEELEPDSIELEAARFGVICHSNRLTTQVRLTMEVLMRSYPPRIIIATTTLAQGVNVGVTSVIVASPYIGEKDRINKRDFWNICGRAGRAFVDGEGKILYAIDETRSKRQIRTDEDIARTYFDTTIEERVESGLLFIINLLRIIADNSNVSFDVLIELIANNEYPTSGEQPTVFEKLLDLIDDELLSLHEDNLVNQFLDDSVEWVDQAFRESLAAIQASADSCQLSEEDVVSFLKARAASILKMLPNKAGRRLIVASSLPLSAAIAAHRDLEFFRDLADQYLQSGNSFSLLDTVVQNIEVWAGEHASSITEDMPEASKLNDIREDWLKGTGLHVLIEKHSDAGKICRDLYGYKLPWIIHSISQILDNEQEEERINAMSQIALLVEIGVPTESAAKIFLAGIRSRVAATELSQLDINFGESVSDIARSLLDSDLMNQLIPYVSSQTAEWLEIVLSTNAGPKPVTPKIAPLKFRRRIDADKLFARSLGKDIFLCSLDGKEKIRIKPIQAFKQVADDPRFVFQKSGDHWILTVRDPKYGLISSR